MEPQPQSSCTSYSRSLFLNKDATGILYWNDLHCLWVSYALQDPGLPWSHQHMTSRSCLPLTHCDIQTHTNTIANGPLRELPPELQSSVAYDALGPFFYITPPHILQVLAPVNPPHETAHDQCVSDGELLSARSALCSPCPQLYFSPLPLPPSGIEFLLLSFLCALPTYHNRCLINIVK